MSILLELLGEIIFESIHCGASEKRIKRSVRIICMLLFIILILFLLIVVIGVALLAFKLLSDKEYLTSGIMFILTLILILGWFNYAKELIVIVRNKG